MVAQPRDGPIDRWRAQLPRHDGQVGAEVFGAQHPAAWANIHALREGDCQVAVKVVSPAQVEHIGPPITKREDEVVD